MKVFKRIPYLKCELEAIENWLNDNAKKGLVLKQLQNSWAEFEKCPGTQMQYSVRYIPGNTDCANTLWWGDLYVYRGEYTDDLPSRQPNEAKLAAAHVLKHILLHTILVAWLLHRSFWQSIQTNIAKEWTLIAISELIFFLSVVLILLYRIVIAWKCSNGYTSQRMPVLRYLRWIIYLSVPSTIAFALYYSFF